MARRKDTFPSLKFHAPTQQWCIYRDNRRITLGKDRLAAEQRRVALIGAHDEPVAPIASDRLTVMEGLELYRQHIKSRSHDRRTLHRVDTAVALASGTHGHLLADSFRGRALRELRAVLVGRRHKRTHKPLSRRYINHIVDALVLAFRWLVSEDHVSSETLERLRAASAELAEHGGGRESEPIGAVTDTDVEVVLAVCSPMLASMIHVHRATGMRPGELCSMRREELSTRPDEPVAVPGLGRTVAAMAFDGGLVWLYAPSRHKNLHRGKPRVIALGAEAQRSIVLPASGLVFRTATGSGFTPLTYGQAIARACLKAGIARFGPNRLRHAAAERIDAAMGADAAAAMLGHSASRRAIDFYVGQQISKAAECAAKAG